MSRITPVLLVLAFSTLLVPGCKKHADGDGHDHSKAPEGKPEVAGGHGGESEHTDEVKLAPGAVARYGVKVQPAQRWALRPTFVIPARVAFNNDATAHVGSPLRGRAVELKVKAGDAVKRGDELAVIESPELGEAQSDYLQRRSAAQLAMPSVELARASWERAKGLFEQSQGISLTEVQRREAEYKAAVAGQKAAESTAGAAENRLHLLGMSQAAVDTLAKTGEIVPRHTLRSPIDGQVIQREVTLGELVGPERESLLVLADTRVLWVLAEVPESRLSDISKGARAWVTVGTVADSTVRKFEGQVALIAAAVDPTTRTAQVRIDVPAESLALRPGMFAQVEIVTTNPQAAEPAPVVAVPDEAVQTVEGGPAVFVPVKGEPNTFAKRVVTVGKSVGGLIPILEGLADGEEYVFTSTFILKAELGKGAAAHEH